MVVAEIIFGFNSTIFRAWVSGSLTAWETGITGFESGEWLTMNVELSFLVR